MARRAEMDALRRLRRVGSAGIIGSDQVGGSDQLGGIEELAGREDLCGRRSCRDPEPAAGGQ